MLKKFNSTLLIFIFSFVFNQISAAENLNIVFVDMDKIIATSNAGKKIQSSMDKFAKKENQKFDTIENKLKKKEQEILKQKNVISKEELDNKIKSFQSELLKLRNDKIDFNQNIIKMNQSSTNKMVNEINKILTQYASDNSVSLIIQKKNIIIGKTELDITPQILKEFNSKVKSID